METFNPFSLNNKTVLVTGASSGIGQQVAISCSKMGANVVITGRNKERLEETYNLLSKGNHVQILAELMDPEERNKFAETVPPLDGIAHCAGIVGPTPVKFIEEKHIRNMIGHNFEMPVLLAGRLLRNKKINKNASFVFMSSIASQFPYIGGGLYSSSKSALEAYSRNLAFEHSKQGIRSNTLVLAMVATPIYEKTKQGMYSWNADNYDELYPLGIGKPEDVANAAIYLLSDASRWVTGVNIILDGGFSIDK